MDPARAVAVTDASSRRRAAVAAGALLALFLGFALAYQHAVPLFEAPDEPSHLQYAMFVYTQGRLPRQQPLEVPGEGSQPPLVYVLAAPLLAAVDLDVAAALPDLLTINRFLYHVDRSSPGNARLYHAPRGGQFFVTDGSLAPLRILRGVSTAFGLLAVGFTFAAGWRLSGDVRLSFLAGVLLALNPQFLFTSAYFSNDSATAALGAAALWIVAAAIADPRGSASRQHYVAGAIVAALGLLTKLSTLPGLGVAALTILAIDRRPRRQRILDALLATSIVLLLAGPYLAWSVQHGGGVLGLEGMRVSAAPVARPEDHGGLSTYFASVYWDGTFESYWARFGWFTLSPPKAVYLAFFALTGTGVLGFCAGRFEEARHPLRSRALRTYLGTAIGATIAAHVWFNLTLANPQGRHLFATAPHVALVLALGLGRLLGQDRTLPIAIVVVCLLLELAGYCLWGILVPTYH